MQSLKLAQGCRRTSTDLGRPAAICSVFLSVSDSQLQADTEASRRRESGMRPDTVRAVILSGLECLLGSEVAESSKPESLSFQKALNPYRTLPWVIFRWLPVRCIEVSLLISKLTSLAPT